MSVPIIDISRGILSSSIDWKKQEKENSIISFLHKTNEGVLIDIGLIRKLYRSINKYEKFIHSASVIDFPAITGIYGIKTRYDFEELNIWPIIKFSDDSVQLRNVNILKIIDAPNSNKYHVISLSYLRNGLIFKKNQYTPVMQHPEVISLIEGKPFIYPIPLFISDFKKSNYLEKMKSPDWFRTLKDAPILWKGLNCIICGSDSEDVRHIIGTSRIVKCSNCGLEYANPQAIINPNNLDKYSSRFDKYKGGESSISRANQNAKIFISDIKAICPTKLKAKLLDVGCASGEFIYSLKRKFHWPDENLFGIDPSPLSIRDAQKLYYINTQNCDAESFTSMSSEFSLITVLNTVEHFSRPDMALKNLRHAIRQDGFMFIGTVPNVNSLPSLLFPEGFIAKHFPDGQHHFQFNPESLSRLCEYNGFKVIRLLGRRRDIVGEDILSSVKWIAYSCGVPLYILNDELEMLKALKEKIERGRELVTGIGKEYAFNIVSNAFSSLENFIGFWRKSIWSSPFLSDTFDIWLKPRN